MGTGQVQGGYKNTNKYLEKMKVKEETSSNQSHIFVIIFFIPQSLRKVGLLSFQLWDDSREFTNRGQLPVVSVNWTEWSQMAKKKSFIYDSRPKKPT